MHEAGKGPYRASIACQLNQQWCNVITLLDRCIFCKAEYPQQQLIETTKKRALTKLLDFGFETQFLAIPAQHLIV